MSEREEYGLVHSIQVVGGNGGNAVARSVIDQAEICEVRGSSCVSWVVEGEAVDVDGVPFRTIRAGCLINEVSGWPAAAAPNSSSVVKSPMTMTLRASNGTLMVEFKKTLTWVKAPW